ATWEPFAWKLDPLSGSKQRMKGTIYHASPDGKWLISANMTTMRRTQPGYGVRVPDDIVRQNIGVAYRSAPSLGPHLALCHLQCICGWYSPCIYSGYDRSYKVRKASRILTG
ncbi:MAG: hypothetical protein P1S60_18635, partial [Anaerolineae bacterium]|nr:hypothetical protein [Anaerolineae bacterium]